MHHAWRRSYPFDSQTMRLELTVRDAILECEAVGASLAPAGEELLLPAATPWRLVKLEAHRRQAREDQCTIEIELRRDAQVYMVQRLLPLILVGLGALLALNLDPVAPPLVGARCSVLIFAMVLISLKSSTDLGLGELTYTPYADLAQVFDRFRAG